MKAILGFLTALGIFQSAFASTFYPVPGSSSPIAFYQNGRSFTQDSHEFLGSVRMDDGKVFDFNIVLNQEGPNVNHYSGMGRIRIQYGRHPGVVEKVCTYPIGIRLTVLRGESPRYHQLYVYLPQVLPTENVDLAAGCPSGEQFTRPDNVWGPITFVRAQP